MLHDHGPARPGASIGEQWRSLAGFSAGRYAGLPQHLFGAAGEHLFLVGGNHEDANPCRCMRNPKRAVGIGLRVVPDPEPTEIGADPLPDFGRVCNYATGENQSVKPTERGGKRAYLAPSAIDEERHRPAGSGRVAVRQFDHLAAEA